MHMIGRDWSARDGAVGEGSGIGLGGSIRDGCKVIEWSFRVKGFRV